MGILDLTANQIKKIENLQNCKELEELWMGSNFVESFDDIDNVKDCKLETIYLERNPVESNPDYRSILLNKLPNLLQIDANMVEDFIHELNGTTNTVNTDGDEKKLSER